MSTDTVQCKNCSNFHEKGFQFCPHCGQKTKDDLTLGVLFYNTISNYFSFDARFFRSFIPLMLKPGFIAKEFVGGKRLRYLHPAQYYLFVSVIFFFLFSFKVRQYNASVDKALEKGFKSELVTDKIEVKPMDSITMKEVTDQIKKNQAITGMSDDEIKELDSIMTTSSKDGNWNLNMTYDKEEIDSLISIGAEDPVILKAMGMDDNPGFLEKRFYQQMLKFQKNSGKGILQAFFDSIPIALFILLPIFAILLKIFYWRRGRFAHHLVFSFYYFSFLFVVMSLVIGVNFFVEIPDWIDFLILLSTYLYLWFAVARFYQQGYFISLIKSGIVTFLYMSFIIPLALFLIIFGSFLFY